MNNRLNSSFLILTLALSSCAPLTVASAVSPTATQPPATATLPPTATLAPTVTLAPTTIPALDSTALKNAAYHSPDFGDFQLVDGLYQHEETQTTLSDQVAAFGDLNADGLGDAVGILFTNSGGSGVFIELAAVINQNGAPANDAPTIALGDRVQITGLTIEAGVIRVSVMTHGPNDPLCCPSQAEMWEFRLVGNQLEKAPK